MNIKSDFLGKPLVVSLPFLTIMNFAWALIFGIVLSVFSVLAGTATPFKLGFVLLFIIIMMFNVDNALEDDKTNMIIDWLFLIILSLVIFEFGLYSYSKSYQEITPITVVKEPHIETKEVDGIKVSTKQVRVSLYNSNSNERLVYNTFKATNVERIALYDNITGQEEKYEYYPFLQFNKTIKYIRNKHE